MARRLILDTTGLNAYERRRFDISRLDGDDLAIAAVTVAEFRTGIELADTAERASDRARILDAITASIAVLDYTEATAVADGRLLAHVRRTGSPRGAHYLMIAAHAVEDSRVVLSMGARARFGDLPGVDAPSPQSADTKRSGSDRRPHAAGYGVDCRTRLPSRNGESQAGR